VTHDQVEAMTLATRIVVLNNKTHTIAQVGTPLQLYERPENTFVAQFIGSPKMNLMPATVTDSGLATSVTVNAGGSATVPVSSADAVNGTCVQLGVRPEDMLPAGEGDEVIYSGQVEILEKLGEVTVVYFKAREGEAQVIAKIPGIADVERGSTLSLTAKQEKLHLFDANGHSFFYK
jgi:alpha-glucoside transport system ATP-binding protein